MINEILISFALIRLAKEFVDAIYTNETNNWKSNLLSLCNTSYMIYAINSNYMNKNPSDAFYFTFSSMFYLLDSSRYTTKDILFWHHILTICVLFYIKNSPCIVLGEKLLLSFEIGNVPMAVIYGNKTYSNKSYRYLFNNKWVMTFDLFWYSIFRIVMPFLFIIHEKWYHIILCLVFVLPSCLWSYKKYKKILCVK